MANSVPELKSLGWRETLTNDEGGVAAAIEPMRIERHFMIRFPRTAARRAIGRRWSCVRAGAGRRADYAVLQSDSASTSPAMKTLGETIRLTMLGGTLEIPANP